MYVHASICEHIHLHMGGYGLFIDWSVKYVLYLELKDSEGTYHMNEGVYKESKNITSEFGEWVEKRSSNGKQESGTAPSLWLGQPGGITH